MKRLLLLSIFLLASISVSAQVSTQNARRIRSVSGAPTGACVVGPPYTDIAINTVDHSEWQCTGASTWTKVVNGGTAPSGSGTSGQVAIWNGTTSLTGDSDLTFATDTLTVTKLGATTLTGAIAGGGQALDNIIIGGTTPLAGTFTTASATAKFELPTSVSFPGSVTDRGRCYYSSAAGIVCYGKGSLNDLSLANNAGGVAVAIPTGTVNVTFGGTAAGLTNLTSALFSSTTNCADSAGAAACGAAPSGSFVIDATTTATVVSTTAVTANSQIILQEDSSLSTRLSVTCNTQSSLTLGALRVTARTAGTSFTATIEAGPTTNPMCVSYWIIN